MYGTPEHFPVANNLLVYLQMKFPYKLIQTKLSMTFMMSETHRQMLRTYGTLLGRVLIGLLFIITGWGFVSTMGLDGMTGMMSSLGLPLPFLVAILVLLIKFGGGIALILGYRVGIASALLIVFTLLATWFGHVHTPEVDLVGTLKNLAIVGGLLQILAFGPGEGWRVCKNYSA
jgi:putative oxidoreductase